MEIHEVPVTQMYHDWALEAAKISLANEDQSNKTPVEIVKALRAAYYAAREQLLNDLASELQNS